MDKADKLMEEMSSYSDDQLWAVVRRPFEKTDHRRLRVLLKLGNQGLRTPELNEEANALVEKFDHWVLVRSAALLSLKQRGYDDILNRLEPINDEILAYYDEVRQYFFKKPMLRRRTHDTPHRIYARAKPQP